MPDSQLKIQLLSDMKSSMKSGDKDRLRVIRSILAEIKQVEVDERIHLDDTRVVAVLNKMSKQRRESITQFTTAKRDDLVLAETAELKIIQAFLPEAMSSAAIETAIENAMQVTAANTMKDMGKVMATLKTKIQGRADMSEVSQLVKAKLTPFT